MELYQMYALYATSRKWKFNVVDIASTEVGGCRVEFFNEFSILIVD